MPIIPPNILSYLGYAAPPLVGAFIGYLTNRVAIRMLFRPLKPWKILGIRVPMTPGVIPSKRHDLALNIGEMVGEHLLTSKEVGKALKKEKFQKHLYSLIKDRIGGILGRDLGALPTLVPRKFKSYYDIGTKTITYQIKSSIHNYIKSEDFEYQVRNTIESSFQHFIEQDVDSVINREARDATYLILDRSIKKMLASPAMEQWVEDFVYGKVNNIVKKKKTIDDLIPESLKMFLLETVQSQTPELLSKFADILKDPEIQDKIILGIKAGVENFIASLGPLSTMVNNFISMETVEQKVREYFQEKEDEITEWLKNEDVQVRVSASILERVRHLFSTPINDFLSKDSTIDVSTFSNTLSQQILAFLREGSTAEAVSTMVQDNIEIYIEGGAIDLNKVVQDLFGEESVEKSKRWISSEGLSLLRTEKTGKAIDSMVESLFGSLLQKPIGRLSNILPAGVREGLYVSIQRMASAMLATEVPGIVGSLNIRSIVAEKVDSLDLLRLEGLLLSIMEEQFKYINLFGGLLGFIIGCCNLFFISFV